MEDKHILLCSFIYYIMLQEDLTQCLGSLTKAILLKSTLVKLSSLAMLIGPQYMTVLQVEVLGKCCSTRCYCLFISLALSYGALAVRNFRPDYGRCRPLGIHCSLKGNHLYSTPEVTEEHEIGKQAAQTPLCLCSLRHKKPKQCYGCRAYLSKFCFLFI